MLVLEEKQASFGAVTEVKGTPDELLSPGSGALAAGYNESPAGLVQKANVWFLPPARQIQRARRGHRNIHFTSEESGQAI
jgi:hypothetical protein